MLNNLTSKAVFLPKGPVASQPVVNQASEFSMLYSYSSPKNKEVNRGKEKKNQKQALFFLFLSAKDSYILAAKKSFHQKVAN